MLPLLHWPGLRSFGQWLVHPAVALPLFVAANWLWHAPRAYELALSSPGWHRLEHGCFLAAALLFWHPVVRPFPGRPAWSQWLLLLPYLVLADVQNTLLAALLTFSNRVLYPHYARVPPLAGLTPLDDQSAAGVLMWVPGSIAFLVPLGWIGLKLLLGQDAAAPMIAKSLRVRFMPMLIPRPSCGCIRSPAINRRRNRPGKKRLIYCACRCWGAYCAGVIAIRN